MSLELKKFGVTYEILDTIEHITLADSFLVNKLGSGNGEAKLYVGSESKDPLSFFEDKNNLKCFFSKADFESFLAAARPEFQMPQQKYKEKEEMPKKYDQLKEQLDSFTKEKLEFTLSQVDVQSTRVYLRPKSKSKYYAFMRAVGLPKISYLSVLKLKEIENGEICYYFKIFIDFKIDLVTHQFMEEKNRWKKLTAKLFRITKSELLFMHGWDKAITAINF